MVGSLEADGLPLGFPLGRPDGIIDELGCSDGSEVGYLVGSLEVEGLSLGLMLMLGCFDGFLLGFWLGFLVDGFEVGCLLGRPEGLAKGDLLEVGFAEGIIYELG